MPVAQGVSPRLFLAGFARPRAVPGIFSLSEGLRPSRCRLPIRTGRTLGPCGHTCLRATDVFLIIYISRIISIILISRISSIRKGTCFWQCGARSAMPVSQDAFPRLIPMVISLVHRPCLGFSHDCGVSDPLRGCPLGPCGHPGGRARTYYSQGPAGIPAGPWRLLHLLYVSVDDVEVGVGAENFGDDDAVGCLIVLEKGGHDAGQGQC